MPERVTPRVKEILSWYRTENNGVITNLYRLLNSGTLAGTGKLVILPVDQGFEHGPARTYGPNPASYDPAYHFELALASGCNAYAAPYGQMMQACPDYSGQIPLILKLNSSDSLYSSKNPISAVTGTIKDALEIGAAAVGFTIYPGSSFRKEMYQEIIELGREARAVGLAVVMWSYPRGEGISKDGETAIDVVAYAAQIAAQLGAHLIKVKPPSAHIEQDAAKKAYEKCDIAVSTLSDRIKHVINSSFAAKRIVIFSGGEAKAEAEILDEVKQLHQGGAFGSIMGRNSFQRPMADGISLLKKVMAIYAS